MTVNQKIRLKKKKGHMENNSIFKLKKIINLWKIALYSSQTDYKILLDIIFKLTFKLLRMAMIKKKKTSFKVNNL